MTQIHLKHEFSDQRIGKAQLKSMNNNGTPDTVDIPVMFGNLKKTISLTTSDVIAMARALQVMDLRSKRDYAASSDPRLMKHDFVNSDNGEKSSISTMTAVDYFGDLRGKQE